VKKYVPKIITEAEIQEIRDSVEMATRRAYANCPGNKTFFRRMEKLVKDSGQNSYPYEQIRDEMSLFWASYSTIREEPKEIGEMIGERVERARARNDHVFFRRLSEAIKSPPDLQCSPTENFLLFFWARSSFAFADQDSFPPLVLFTVKDLSRLMQVVFETSGTTESSLEAIIGRKLKLKTIKHCKVAPAQTDRWIQQFKAYKADHSAQVKDRLDMWDNFLREQQFVNSLCKKFGTSPAEAKHFLDYYLKNQDAFRRYFAGKHSDKTSKQPRRHV
jgi:hypothetical protein